MVEKIKDNISIVKEAALVLLFLTFFLFPSRMSNRMQQAGFYQGSVKNDHSLSLIQETLHPDSLAASLQNIDSFKSRISQQDFINRIFDNKARSAGWIFFTSGDEWRTGKPKRIDSVKPPDDARGGL